MIIGMRGHDFGRMEPRALAAAIRETGFEATQLAFTKAFPAPAEQYMTREALCDIREAFAGQVCVLGAPPNFVVQPQKIFVFVASST